MIHAAHVILSLPIPSRRTYDVIDNALKHAGGSNSLDLTATCRMLHW